MEGNKKPRSEMAGVWHTLTIRLQNSLSCPLTLPQLAVIMGTSGRDTATAASPADHKGRSNTMATIKVAYEVSEKAFKAVEALAVETVETDINWNGAVIDVERDDYTCVECNDEYAGTQLLRCVYDVIDSAS